MNAQQLKALRALGAERDAELEERAADAQSRHDGELASLCAQVEQMNADRGRMQVGALHCT